MTYFKGPCTKFEVELMSFFIHFGCICIETQIMERFLINNDDPSSIPENIEKYHHPLAGPPQIVYVEGSASRPGLHGHGHGHG